MFLFLEFFISDICQYVWFGLCY